MNWKMTVQLTNGSNDFPHPHTVTYLNLRTPTAHPTQQQHKDTTQMTTTFYVIIIFTSSGHDFQPIQ